MGHHLDGPDTHRRGELVPPTCRSDEVLGGLDAATRALVCDIVASLARERPDASAVILYGSVARGDQRPLDDPAPSDVDLLVVLDTDDEQIALRDGEALFCLLGQVYDRHLGTRREAKVMFASRSMREWDPTFIANVARDGQVLWARRPLPLPLSEVTERAGQPSASG